MSSSFLPDVRILVLRCSSLVMNLLRERPCGRIVANLQDANIYDEIDLEDLHGPAQENTIALDVRDADADDGTRNGGAVKGILPGRSDEVRALSADVPCLLDVFTWSCRPCYEGLQLTTSRSSWHSPTPTLPRLRIGISTLPGYHSSIRS